MAAFVVTIFWFKSSTKFLNVDDDVSYDWHQWLSAFHHDGFFLTVFVFAVAETVTNVLSSLLNHILRADVFTKVHLISFLISFLCAHPTTEATVAALQQLCGNFLSAVLVPVLGSIQHAADEVHAQQAAGHEASYWMETFITPEVVLSVLVLIVASFFCGL
ncbi:hypothetical protein DYB25_007075 [Aphanomyces astaci]|nr:hypothetical protein DYB25_007075 [Aphanomyces astaci]